MSTPRVLMIRAPGTNCDEESAFAFEQAGAAVDRVHINRLLEDRGIPDQYQILCLPGGFSYGDDIAAGRILANQIRHYLDEVLNEFKAAEKLIFGICNGFQVLIRSGLLLAGDDTAAPATLTWNDSGRFEDRWVELVADNATCVFLNGIDRLYLPVAHAEGKFVARDRQQLQQLEANHQCALRYCNGNVDVHAEVPYPSNPNGSQDNIAGLCDSTGRVFGLMPHPERHIDPTHHPRWTRMKTLPDAGDGMKIFENAVAYFR